MNRIEQYRRALEKANFIVQMAKEDRKKAKLALRTAIYQEDCFRGHCPATRTIKE